MQLYKEKKDCFGCGACAAACPAGAVTMRADGEGFLYPSVDESRCTGCGLCVKSCPAHVTPAAREGRFYALRCRDEALLRKSASGGAFSLLAETVLARGGMVCGAVFDGRFQVRHVLSRDIAPMRKSKYVQSDTQDCFAPVRQALEEGTEVLFSGTPCQCAALTAFLGRKPEKLLLVSLVCRGAASPGLWQEYVRWLEKDGALEAFDFRDKRRKNDGHTVSYTVSGAETAVSMHQDGFCRLYNLGLTYRPCCYSCPYCGPDNDFDLTIGDFWGVEKTWPDLGDGRGTSLVIARGDRARRLLEGLAGQADIRPCAAEQAAQPSLLAPAKEPLLRRFLFRDLGKKDEAGRCDMSLLLKKYGGPSI